MKRNIFGLFLVVSSLFAFSACEKEDDVLVSDVPQAVFNTFQAKYPNILPEWESKQGYYIAEFFQEGMETEMWITAQGEWAMTEMDLGMNLNLLPQQVLDAFQAKSFYFTVEGKTFESGHVIYDFPMSFFSVEP